MLRVVMGAARSTCVGAVVDSAGMGVRAHHSSILGIKSLVAALVWRGVEAQWFASN